MKSSKKTSLLDMVQGGVKERVGIEFEKVIDNIMNINVEAQKKRTINLKIEFKPDSERKTIGVTYHVNSKLVPLNPVSTVVCMGADLETGEVSAVEMTAQIPGQRNFYDETEQEPRKVIPITVKQALAE